MTAPTYEELQAENERLLSANDTLAKHVISTSARLEEGKRALLAIGWDACADLAQTGPPNKADNPYRQSVETFGTDQ
jgi:hypothetical protein